MRSVNLCPRNAQWALSMSGEKPEPEKLSLYKHASPLARQGLVQGKLQQSSNHKETLLEGSPRGVSPLPHSLNKLTHSLSLSDCGETTPITTPTTSTTEVWSSERPFVQVIKHSSPQEFPSPVAGEGRFSSDFVEFQPTTSAVQSCDVGDSPAREDSSQLQKKKKPRKGKGERVIPSRYMSSTKTTPASSMKTTPSLSSSSSLSSLLIQGTYSSKKSTASMNKTQLGKKTSKSAQKPGSRRDDSFKIPSSFPRVKTQPPSLSTTLPRHPFTPSAITSSTPKISSVSSQPETSTHHGSFMNNSGNTSSVRTVPTSKHKSKTSTTTTANTQCSSDLELLYCRLLQATYLDVKSAKSLREQEEAAKSQLFVLWEEVEKRRRECDALRRELETIHRQTALSSVLDIQTKDLSPVINTLPQLQQYHSTLSYALDATRHELPTSGLIAVTEQQLEEELSQSEQLLSEIVSIVRHNVPSVESFADTTKAAVTILDKEFQELEKCWKELSGAVKMQIQETSLAFEKKQRQRTLHPPSLDLLSNTCTE